VKAIAGEDGVAVCRSLLDGIDDDGEGELQSRVTEGRCTGEKCRTLRVVRYVIFRCSEFASPHVFIVPYCAGQCTSVVLSRLYYLKLTLPL
jgi:hypothetical protein